MTDKKILVRMPNWIGDAVMAVPALSALRVHFKDAQITLLAKPLVAALFEYHPDIDRIIIYEDRGKHYGLIGLWRLIRSLRNEGFDLAFLFQNALEAALIAAGAGIPKRVGYAGDGRTFLLTGSLKKKGAPSHRREAYLALMRLVGFIGWDGFETRPTLVVTPEEQQAAWTLLESYGISKTDCIVGINPGAAYGPSKRWLTSRFAAVADRLVAEFNVKVLIFGGPAEIKIAENVQREMKNRSIVLAGKTSVREMMALVSRCRLFLTNDSGPMHVASALEIPLVATFGPTNPDGTSPAGNRSLVVQNKADCAPCRHRECPIDHRCMEGLSVEAVYEAAVKQLNGFREKAGAVFLDRDGTINEDVGYLDRLQNLSLIPGAAAAIAKLNRKGIPVFLITNQSGVGRGFFTEKFVGEVHRYLQVLLAKEGASLNGIYYCPHHPETMPCQCRKPSMGMIEKAISEYPIDLSRSYVVGDKSLDMALAQRGAKGVLVQTGYGKGTLQELRRSGMPPDHVSNNLSDAVEWILRDMGERND
ncbi:MAG: lipopolysaccharide heptosyltransferase II [Nitrospiria bacterium]